MFGVEEGSPVSNKTLLNWNAWYTIVDKPLDHVQKQPVICVTLTTLALCAKKTIKVLRKQYTNIYISTSFSQKHVEAFVPTAAISLIQEI